MSIITKKIAIWLDKHPKLKQWLWFISLWCLGLLAVNLIAYPIKYLMRLMD